MNMESPIILEPTHRRLCRLAWEFAWRYYLAWIGCFAVAVTLVDKAYFGAHFGSVISMRFFVEGMGLPPAVLFMLLEKKRIHDFALAEVPEDATLGENAESFALPERKTTVWNADGGLFRQYFMLFTILYLAAYFMMVYAEHTGVRSMFIMGDLFVFTPVKSFVFSYLAFRFALGKAHRKKRLCLVMPRETLAEAEREIVSALAAPVFPASSDPKTLVRIAWEYLWRSWALALAIGFPLMIVMGSFLYAIGADISKESIQSVSSQAYIWIGAELFAASVTLFTLRWLQKARFCGLRLRFDYGRHDVMTPGTPRWIRYVVHLPFVAGYLLASFVFNKLFLVIGLKIETEPFSTLWDAVSDFAVIYLMLFLAVKYRFWKSRYYIVSEPPPGNGNPGIL